MTVEAQQHPGTSRIVAVAVAAGAAVSVALGVYGGQHQPTGQAVFTFGFGSMIAMKVWLALAVGALALVQLVSALWMYGRLGHPAGRAVAITHRLSGTIAVLVSLPVAYHCLWSLGFQTYDTRVLVHSLFGCGLYGAFVTKILALRSATSPGWLLPVAGGLVFSAIVIVVLTSSIWFLGTTGLPTGSAGY
jgi:hypothetical protein